MARLYTYIIPRDQGFAPNPFHGVCTLATCKPVIRRVAASGDWVAGVGSKTKGQAGKLVFAMQVTDILTFDEYWDDPAFQDKKPDRSGTREQQVGDNIYHWCSAESRWIQAADSCHSGEDGCTNNDQSPDPTGELWHGLAAHRRLEPADADLLLASAQ